MSPEEALEQMRVQQEKMAKEAERMVERVRKLQDISYCMESNHEWTIQQLSQTTTHTEVDHIVVACNHCDAFFCVTRTNEKDAIVTPLYITHENKDMPLQDFLDNKEEEE